METKAKAKIAGVILVFCALAIVVCAILLKNYQGKTSSGAPFLGVSSTVSKISVSATPTAEPSNPMVYRNTDYGFEVTFPDSMSGFAVEKTSTDQSGVLAKYSVLLPTDDKNYKNLLNSKAIALEFYIYDPLFWAKPEKEVRSSEIAKGEKYVYTYSIWEESPADLKTITDKDFVKIIETFKLTGS